MEALSVRESEGQNEHSRVITLLIQACITEARLSLRDLDAVAISEGPGSYTSLRVGFSTAKGICFSLDKPLITVSSLAALASAAFDDAQDLDAFYCPMIDARRMEVYTALFTASGKEVTPVRALIVDEHSFEQDFSNRQKIIFSGNGAEKCKTVINSPFSSFSNVKRSNAMQIIPHAIKAFSNKNFTNTTCAVPQYFKTPNITSARVLHT